MIVYYAIMAFSGRLDGSYEAAFSTINLLKVLDNYKTGKIVASGKLEFSGLLKNIDKVLFEDERVKTINEVDEEANKNCKFDLKYLENKLKDIK